MIDGPEDQPARTWHAFPPERTPETERTWARKELAVFAAGYLGEREFFGAEDRVLSQGPDGDRAIVEYLSFLAMYTESEATLVRTESANSAIEKDQLRRRLPQLRWDAYLHLIDDVERGVIESIHMNRDRLQYVAKRLLADGFVRGKDIYQMVGVTWVGMARTVPWLECKRDH